MSSCFPVLPQTNMNHIRDGLDRLETALDCKYVAVEAATAIGTVRHRQSENPLPDVTPCVHAWRTRKISFKDRQKACGPNAGVLFQVAVPPLRALQIIKAIHAEAPMDPEVHLRHGRLLKKMERGEEACEAFRTAAGLMQATGRKKEAQKLLANCSTPVRCKPS